MNNEIDVPRGMMMGTGSVNVGHALRASIQVLPDGMVAEFEVVAQTGQIGKKTWTLRDVSDGAIYQVTPDTPNGRDVQSRKESIGPSIIVRMDGQSMIAFHLPTGEFYRTGAPPASI